MTASILIAGLPGSGKTTFLAALWHLVTSRESSTELTFGGLEQGDYAHLNILARRWREGSEQIRTELGSEKLVSMRLSDAEGLELRADFPDVSGEAFRALWEERNCDPMVADLTGQGARILLFVHADTIRAPRWITEANAELRSMNLQPVTGEETAWTPRAAPTQVVLVDMLQLLLGPVLKGDSGRVGVILSAWDLVEAEELTPEAFLAERLPLLKQYLDGRHGPRAWRAYGVSATGGELESDRDRLLDEDLPSERIKVTGVDCRPHDLTAPLAWLLDRKVA